MRSDAETVEEYLADLPDGRRAAIEAVRDTIVANLPGGFEETMNWGMITYEVPLATFPETYNGRPLMLAGLASQKRHMAVYLSAVYADERTADDFRERYLATGKKLDMGASCVRFTKIDDLPVDLIGEVIAGTSLDEFLDLYGRRDD